MKYSVEIGGRVFVVDIEGTEVSLEGRPVAAALDAAAGPIRRLITERRSLEVVLEPGDVSGLWTVSGAGVRLPARVLDERSRSIKTMVGKTTTAGQPASLKAPMPGLVVRVLVIAGDHVTAGAGLVVMEAMKMENELKAAAAGTVKRVLVKPGDKVEKGAMLIELE